MEDLAHAPSREEALRKLIPYADYPKMGLAPLLWLDFRPTQSNPRSGLFVGVEYMARTLSHQAETFLEQAQFVSAEAVRSDPDTVPSEPGIYGWWFDEALKNVFEGTQARDGFHLLYVGIAPSAPPKEVSTLELCATDCSIIAAGL